MIPLTLTRPLVVLDCETTGLDAQEARIIEIGMVVLYPEGSCHCNADMSQATCKDCGGTGRTPTLEWRTLVNPLVPIPPIRRSPSVPPSSARTAS